MLLRQLLLEIKTRFPHVNPPQKHRTLETLFQGHLERKAIRRVSEQTHTKIFTFFINTMLRNIQKLINLVIFAVSHFCFPLQCRISLYLTIYCMTPNTFVSLLFLLT